MPTQLGTMASNVARKLGDNTVGQYFSELQVKQTIGDSYKFYVMKMVTLAAGYFETTTDLDLVAGNEAVSVASLSPAFWRISQLFRYVIDGEIPLRRNEKRYSENIRINAGSGDSYIPDYKQRGQNIILMPQPQSSEVGGLKLDYIYIPTFPTSVSLNTFTFDPNFPDIYEQNVEIRSAIKLLETKDAVGGVSDINTFREELEALDKAFFDTVMSDEQPDEVAYVGLDYYY